MSMSDASDAGELWRDIDRYMGYMDDVHDVIEYQIDNSLCSDITSFTDSHETFEFEDLHSFSDDQALAIVITQDTIGPLDLHINLSSDDTYSTNEPHNISEHSEDYNTVSDTSTPSKERQCVHYSRDCYIISPCCENVYSCRHCHNEKEDDKHVMNRFSIVEVQCSSCGLRQEKSNKCKQCDIIFGKYFCNICNLWDHEGLEKQTFHCVECGICRVGGRENYFHCKTCHACYVKELENNHVCIDGVMKGPCPICLEDLFESTLSPSVLRCGHVLHRRCLRLMLSSNNISSHRCPLCKKSMVIDTMFRDQMDLVISGNPMSESINVNAYCNDCEKEFQVDFHCIGKLYKKLLFRP